jgi:acyl transferase domain-containing protein
LARTADRSLLLDERLSIAALNSPSLCVVSGPIDAIEELEKRLEQESVGCKRLRTSHAFHSAMMDPMLDAFEDEVRRVTLHAPSIPICVGSDRHVDHTRRSDIHRAIGEIIAASRCASEMRCARCSICPERCCLKWGLGKR